MRNHNAIGRGSGNRSMVILVTGATGFIGRNLVESLRDRHTVLSPPRSEMDLLNEQAVRSFLRGHTIDVVIHCATTPGHRNAPLVPDLTERNLRMFFSLVRNQRLFGKMLFLSSGAAYGMKHYQQKMKEEYFDTYIPDDPHGLSKYVCSKYIERAENIVELRLFGVFGKYEDYAIRFISNAICKAVHGLPITIKQNRLFDYVYIEDLIQVVEHFIGNDPLLRAYNVTPDVAVELKTLAEMVRDISGKSLDIWIQQEGLGLEYSGDNTRLRREMPGWRLTPLPRAIQDLYSWYMENKRHINSEALYSDK